MSDREKFATPLLAPDRAEKAQNALMELPTDISDLVDFFVLNDVKGTRGNAVTCPVAIYLTRKSGTPTAVASDVYLFTGGEGHPYPLPTTVKEFIKLFDRGYLPCLEYETPQTEHHH